MIARAMERSSRDRRVIVIATCVAVLLGAAAAYWFWGQSSTPAQAARPPARAAVPVSVANAVRKDVPVYLTGLGTVQASLTVAIHSQVDGKLQEVAFTEGQHVKKGDVLARIDPRLFQAALDQARAKKAQDEALKISAVKDLERFTTLGVKGFQTQQSIDQQQGKVDQLIASIAADDAAIETAQTQLEYTVIRAPNDGRIGVRLVDPGNIVRASDPGALATLVLVKPSAVNFTLPARTLDDVRGALQRGPVDVVAYDQDNRQELAKGTLLLIDNTIDQATATIRLKAMFPNEDEKLWPGEFVNARILLDTQRNVITIPSAAVQRGPKGLFTWVVGTNNTATPRPIETGVTIGDTVVVTAGIEAGERVVTGGQYKLQTDVPVSIGAPQMAGAGSES